MRSVRLPWAVFAVLAVATVGAFFLTQHLKTTNPLISGSPRTDPPAINPLHGKVCVDLVGQRVSFRTTRISFYLTGRADTVNVYVVNSVGNIVATATGSGRRYQPNRRALFSWNGRESGGRLAPAGTYTFRVNLARQNRTFPITGPGSTVQVRYGPPRPAVTAVTVTGARATTSAGAGPATIAPPHQTATIHFRPGDYRSLRVDVYRTDGPGGTRLVKSFGASPRASRAVWDGTIHGRPAPAGTYLIGLTVIDQACDQGRFPVVMPPVPGSTPHAGVTVRYLAATPPLAAQPAGALASVPVQASGRAFSWQLRAAGSSRVIFQGSEPAGRSSLLVRVPRAGAGLYELSIRSSAGRTVVPLVASASDVSGAAGAKVLVVLPVLSWQGQNQVDDSGDGLPTTLAGGDRIDLDRPLAAGLPSGFADEAALISYLQRTRRSFQLTTDVALADGSGAQLSGHTGLILDGSFRWLPSSLVARLRSFARGGGRVLSLGTGSLQSQAPVGQLHGIAAAGPPAPLSPDPFGAHHGGVQRTAGQLVTPFSDPLGIFGQIPAITGFRAYQPITPPSGPGASLAGIAPSVPAIAGFRVGSGRVVEVGLPGFASALAGNPDVQTLLSRTWQLLNG